MCWQFRSEALNPQHRPSTVARPCIVHSRDRASRVNPRRANRLASYLGRQRYRLFRTPIYHIICMLVLSLDQESSDNGKNTHAAIGYTNNEAGPEDCSSSSGDTSPYHAPDANMHTYQPHTSQDIRTRPTRKSICHSSARRVCRRRIFCRNPWTDSRRGRSKGMKPVCSHMLHLG
ncbi:hypothetical protein BO78DRAFT_61055 [Aspergillus sclerotiicarbonarius CBS 121057]|uniref:Uncharacterized protein n=1 Tax=Aspergillus sclerotiicarbonarius (strain CBS 121057 / IBT 28362) TaxID=1448318 RepID=A0A319EM18_ASPSB|nr:hypothetical protein BO78DRAFT_61055 [Aspergillus sclerotiicarbonarius CBS 121057]